MTNIFVLIGASGVGKTTLAKAVVRCSEQLVIPVGVTTRRPRIGERQGIDYRFISHKTFQQWQQENLFIETATYQNEQYGILKDDILELINKGFDILTILTQDGLQTFEKLFGQKVTSLFITPPSEKELKRRRLKRDNWKALTQEDDIFGMNRAYDFKITNDHLGIACQQICQIRKMVKEGK
ncbi:guanylate kinase [Candidatus Liberibacter solanacearum]|uniref:Guanylate kinase n=2 Tax=Candidatus Liberibacter solanacearum TaxID=556287 RepID=A0A0F4VJJ1_9HYPH|nr:guanylate kinase [Candidatus Liberibacter solanacearum]KJZ81616.1 Guanylate kinase [Candidatus Liberibacter solanacearum]KQC48905.1 guanylate kinase [Candidatus Liberibacter solanacearum]